MLDPGIIRNRLKIAATIANAQAFLELQKEPGGFDAFLWSFVGGKPKKRARPDAKPRATPARKRRRMSRELKQKADFVSSVRRFVTPSCRTVGMFNDHAADCFRRREVGKSSCRGAHSAR